jgi:glycosyltransferase involved in cell wall biosynthesis
VTTVHFVVPDGVDDLARPTGGNTYDRNLGRGLTSNGWLVFEHPVSGFWSRPDVASLVALDTALRRIPDGAVVLLDGLVASRAPEVLAPHAPRVRLVVLVHMPLGHRVTYDGAEDVREREGAVLWAAAAVVTTSAWSRRRVIGLYALPADRVHVAKPGVDSAELATGTATGEALLCVAAVTADKGHDVLLDALATLRDLSWRCVCVGSLDRDPAFVEALRRRSLDLGLADRVCFAGTATGVDLDRAYDTADVMVLASRAETYGMVVTEALARGLPVIATDVGGVTEALGHGADETRPGLLVPPEHPTALAGALRSWLGDAELRARLRRAARERRESLCGWSTTASIVAGVLAEVQR